jgi:hypothetical protein
MIAARNYTPNAYYVRAPPCTIVSTTAFGLIEVCRIELTTDQYVQIMLGPGPLFREQKTHLRRADG